MIKDPLNNIETPYELLHLDPNSSRDEVHKALPRFMKDRKNLPRLGKANEAVAKLRDPKGRLEIDFFYYTIGNINGEEDHEIKDSTSLMPKNIPIPLMKTEDFYSDLEKENFSVEYNEIVLKEKKMSISDDYDDLLSIKLNPDFDI